MGPRATKAVAGRPDLPIPERISALGLLQRPGCGLGAFVRQRICSSPSLERADVSTNGEPTDEPRTQQAQPVNSGTRPIRSGRHESAEPKGRRLWIMSFLALGVVYGDIGTSPLYAISECFFGDHHVAADVRDNILGVLSLITWSLIFTISIQYLGIILRADHRGEGGILALSALATAKRGKTAQRLLGLLGLLGAAFLYSDGMITPAISVLSAVEGLEVLAPSLQPYVVPITLVIIVLLFFIQWRGTAKIGAIFGPIMVVYFLTIATLGVTHIIRDPSVLAAVNPVYAFDFFVRNGRAGFLVLGGVFLVMTGAEALYADLGHFGRSPIRRAWYFFVLPSLLLNYFGQGSLLIHQPTLVKPYYQMAPEWFLLPLVVLSSLAAVIASQAVISGTFSLTMQAMQSGFSPRLHVRHTSDQTMGQIYLPAINWLLMLSCLALVITFGSSTNLAAAYGVSISMTMIATSALFFFVARDHWGWPLPAAIVVTSLFLFVDGSFFCANIVKVVHGGWFPLVVTTIIFTLMTTWKTGRRRLGERLRAAALPLDAFLAEIARKPPIRVPGTAVFLSGTRTSTPGAMLHNLKHNKVLHERVMIVTVRTEPLAFVAVEDRHHLTDHGNGFLSLEVSFGFKDDPNLPEVLKTLTSAGGAFKSMETSYFLGRETLVIGKGRGMARWRRRLFGWLSRNSLSAAAFFSLPPNRVVELGMHVEI